MTTDRWQQVQSLCHAALARPANERAAFLADACRDDPSLCVEVQSLIAHAESSPSFLDTPVIAGASGSLVGRQLGAYRIDAAIGAGGMGEVYRARDTRLGRDVALKIVPTVFASDPQRRTRFEREARAVAALNHPNICTIYDVGHADGVDFLVMELLHGESLAARLKKGPLPLAEALARGIEIADALDRAHQQGIIHRDLKPDNVMLATSGSGKGTQAKLLDFGLARIVATAAAAGTPVPADTIPRTDTGALLGTLQYMSPEQIEGHPADTRSDIFAFGALLYEMVTGRRAFEGTSTAALMAAILREEPPPVHPPELGRIVRRCLSKDPMRRYQAARDLLNDLEDIQQSLDSGQLETPPLLALPSSRARARLAWVVASAALLLAAIAGWSALTARPADAPVTRSTLLAPEGTEFDFAEGAPTLSPDGRRLAFLARRRDGSRQIWVQALDSLSAQPLAGTEGATHPFWAPDGTALGFFSDLKLRTLDLTGSGMVRALCPVERNARGGAWGPDGTILFARSGMSEIYRISANGGSEVRATAFDAKRDETAHRFPKFLPDGRHFLFYSNGRAEPGDPPERYKLFVASLDSTMRKWITWADSSVAYSSSGHLLFLRGDTLFAQRFDASQFVLAGAPIEISDRVSKSVRNEAALSVGSDGTLVYQAGLGELLQLAWMDRTGRLLGTVGAPGRVGTVALSHDGRKVALAVRDPGRGRDIWVRDLERDTASKVSFEPGDEDAPVWSPDDRRLLFWMENDTGDLMVSKAVDGAGRAEVVYTPAAGRFAVPTSFSSDGSVLAMMMGKGAGATQEFDVGLLRRPGDSPQLLNKPEFMEMNGQLAPLTRARWLVYDSKMSGRTEIYVQRVDREMATFQISTAGGSHPRWRRDGRELFYLSPEAKLMAVDITLEPRFSMGIPKALFEPKIRPLQLSYQYDVAQDGQRFLVVRTVKDQGEPPLTMIQNWAKEIADR